MLQTHYRSTLDFSNEALQASEKGLKRLWEAYEFIGKVEHVERVENIDAELNDKILAALNEFDTSMNDDFNTAKVLASMFELVPIINSIKDKLIDINTIQSSTITLIQQKFKSYLEDIFGLLPSNEIANSKLNEVMNLLIEIRKEAKIKKDFATSDKIRNQLTEMGINLKDEKGGEMTWSL
jgi:cysteinyl-tRNA synthetase